MFIGGAQLHSFPSRQIHNTKTRNARKSTSRDSPASLSWTCSVVSTRSASEPRFDVAQSLPKRPEWGAWRKAGAMLQEGAICRHFVHLKPLPATPLPSAGAVWGTRGPEFKSRRPDTRTRWKRRVFSCPNESGPGRLAQRLSRRPPLGKRGNTTPSPDSTSGTRSVKPIASGRGRTSGDAHTSLTRRTLAAANQG